MRPVLKRLHSPDIADLESFRPGDDGCFGFLLQAMFGPEDGEGEESFDLIVCTPSWLSGELEKASPIVGRHHLIVEQYDIGAIRAFLERYARSCSGSTWQDVARTLSRIGKWEFEDYVP